jgi:hypothetical protein
MSEQKIEDVVWAASLGGVDWVSINDKPWWKFFGSRTRMYRSLNGGIHWSQIVAPGETMCVQPQVAAALRKLHQANSPNRPKIA